MIEGMNGIQHIGIPVIDPAVSIDFYTRLGFKNLMHSPFENENGSGECWMYGLGNTVLELYLVPEIERAEIISRSNGHIDHIAFDVDDIDKAFQSAKDMGLTVDEPSPKKLPFWSKGCRYFNVIGPVGERIEFCEILK